MICKVKDHYFLLIFLHPGMIHQNNTLEFSAEQLEQLESGIVSCLHIQINMGDLPL